MQKTGAFNRKAINSLPSRNRASRSVFPDDLWKLYRKKRVSLLIKVLPEKKRGGLPLILLEGNRASLEWLADSLLAQAGDKRDCSFFFSPDGPGNIYFNKKSEFGIYIHRLPCLEEAAQRRWRARAKAERRLSQSKVSRERTR